MGLFDRLKRRNEKAPAEYSMIHSRYPMANGEELIERFDPPWADRFPDFPYEFVGRPAMRTSFTERMRDVFSISAADSHRVLEMFEEANELIADAHELAEFPHFELRAPNIENGSDLEAMPVCWIRCIPFTEKTGRVSKFPFRFEFNTGRMRKTGAQDAAVKMEASLFPDGLVGKIESQLAMFDPRAQFGHFWMISGKLVDGKMTVSRVAESLPDGGMPTLYTIGR